MKKEPVTLQVFRGERIGGQRPRKSYASDPGDFGVGKYYSTNESFAKAYGVGKATKYNVSLDNPLELTADEAIALSEPYKTVRGTETERLAGALKLREDLLTKGYDGLIVTGYEGGRNAITVVDFRTPIPKLEPEPYQVRNEQQVSRMQSLEDDILGNPRKIRRTEVEDIEEPELRPPRIRRVI